MIEPTDREVLVFSAARRLPASQRAAYLNEACAGDAALLQRIEELLQASDEAGAFLESPAAVPSGPIVHAEKPGDYVGRYKLLQQIGEGGCGIVYMAEQEEPVRRRVALKVIKLGMDTKSVIGRFEAERQALALMDHPSIARVLDAGTTETGRPYFVMELVRGIKITDHCDQNNLSTRERLDLFIQVCQAIQHAHQKGVIHRDIKPSNILVTTNDGALLPKVIDFGIAKATNGKLTDKTVFTAFEQFIGTPAYMSPEQAELSAMDIDTRSDIYSLGVLLYELLIGQTPFDAKELLQAGLDEIRRTIREQEPARPSTRLCMMLAVDLTEIAKHRNAEPPRLINLVRGDLDWIVMRALEKDRSRRYETASGLAADIQRHLKNEPVVARPPSELYRIRKLIRRNKFTFTAASIVMAVLVIGLVASTVMFFKEQQAWRQAETEAVKSRQVAQFLEDTLKGVGPSVALGRDTTMLREILDKTVQRVGTELTNQPAVEAELETTIGDVYHDIGDYQRAEALQRHALELRRKVFGNESLPVANSLGALTRALEEQNRNAEAELCVREELAIYRKLQGEANANVAYALNSLAVQLDGQGKTAEAESLYRQALAMRRKLLGSENKQVADTLADLASVLEEKGDLDGAIEMNRECLVMLKKLYGNQYPDMEVPLDNLANELTAERKFSEAEPVVRDDLALQEKMLGESHPHLIRSYWILFNVLQNEGSYAEAEPLARELVALQRKRLGDNDPEVAAALKGLGLILNEEGKAKEAETVISAADLLQGTRSASKTNNTTVVIRQVLDAWAMPPKASETNLAHATAVPDYGQIDETVDQVLLEANLKRIGNDLGKAQPLLDSLIPILIREGKDHEAETLFDNYLTQESPNNSARADLLQMRGVLRALSGHWKDATTDFSEAAELKPATPQLGLCMSLLQQPDLRAYRDLCHKTLQEFAASQDCYLADRTAKPALLLPVDGIDFKRACRLADFASTVTSPDWFVPWAEMDKALAEYRCGRFDSAHDWAGRVVANDGADPSCQAAAYFIQACALVRSGQLDSGRIASGKGAALEKEVHNSNPDNFISSWADWAAADYLHQEFGKLASDTEPTTIQTKQ